MLKPAAHMANVSAEVKNEVATREQQARERTALEAEKKARLDQEHQAFSIKALAAARAGELAVAFPGHELSLPRLNQEGFVAKRLTRRSDFEVHLSTRCESKKEEVVRECDRVISDCEGLVRFQGDALHHRNPLVSFFETLWRGQGSKEELNIELVLAYARVQSPAHATDLERVRPQLQRALALFLELKELEAKYQSVCWENLTVPITANNATFVSWESAEDGRGFVESFSAQLLKWLATGWPEVSKEIGEWIEESAKEGETSLELFVRRCNDGWRISRWDPPGSAAYVPDEEDEDEDVWWSSDSLNSSMFCAPSLAAAELELNGYSVSVESVPLASSANSSESAGQDKVEMLRISIAWAVA